MECDRYERKRGKIKFSPYKQMDRTIKAATIQRSNEQVAYTIKTNVHTVSTHTNVAVIPVSYTHLDVYKRQLLYYY